MKKRSLCFVLAGLLSISIVACKGGNGIQIMDAGTDANAGTEADEGIGADEGTEISNKASEQAEGSESIPGMIPVTHETSRGSIGMLLPEDWAYQIEEAENGCFSIDFHPQSESQGTIRVEYTDSFGVCGTGLVQEDCMINGKKGSKGTYDNNSYWEFISFSGKEGYVIYNYAGNLWWKEYESQVNRILETLALGEEVQKTSELLILEHDQPLKINSSGNELLLTLQDVDANGGGSVHLSYAGNEIKVADYTEWLTLSCVAKLDSAHVYALVGLGFSNDMGETYLVKISKDGMEVCDSRAEKLGERVTENYIEMQYKVDVLGSYTGTKYYSIQNDKFYSDEQTYGFYHTQREEGRQKLVLKEDIPVKTYGDTETLKKGTVIYPTGCDTDNCRFYFEYKGREGDILEGSFEYELNEEGFGCSIGGVDEHELFQELPYAG